jgi:hypothetical protein
MPQHGMALKGFLCCLRKREFVANSPRSKLGSGLEFPTPPLKEASSEFPRDRKPEVGAPRLPSSRPKALNEGGEGDLRKVFARQELVMTGSMSDGGMGCRYENKDQDLFDVLPMVSGIGTGEQLGEYQIGESGSVFRVPTGVYARDQIENGWEACEDRFPGNNLTIYCMVLVEREFQFDVFFYVANGACAMRMFAHDAIPPVEGAARRGREWDKFSAGFGSAGVHAAMARGCQRTSAVRGIY